MGKIVLVKNNKGGVGKSWLTLQLAAGMMRLHKFKKSILILTSDNQNNIYNFAGHKEKVKGGLESWLTGDNGEYALLKGGIFFIPLNFPTIPKDLSYNFLNFMDTMKSKFDYIFIDASPVLTLDNKFIEVADDIVIPTFLDTVTSESIFNMLMLESVEISKVKAIIPNRCMNTKLEKICLNELKNVFLDTNVYISEPIKQSSILLNLMDKGKTVYESENKLLNDTKNKINKVLEVIK